MSYQGASEIAGVMMAYRVLAHPDRVSEPARDEELVAMLKDTMLEGADLDKALKFRDWILGGMSEPIYQETSMVAGLFMAHRMFALLSHPDSDPAMVLDETWNAEVLAMIVGVSTGQRVEGPFREE